MKQKLFILVSLPFVLLAAACGSNNDQPATTVAAVGATTVTCPSGQVVYNNTCVTTVNGQPYPGYNGQYNTTPPPTCAGGNGQYWNNGYSYNNGGCYNNGYGYNGGGSYRWYYYGGFIYYW